MLIGCGTAQGPAGATPAASVYRSIESLAITARAKAAPGADAALCETFRLTEAQVRDFLATAGEVDVRTYARDLDAAPCMVEGTLKLGNGLTARWDIEMGRRGRMVFDDDQVTLLHCATCAGPFVE